MSIMSENTMITITGFEPITPPAIVSDEDKQAIIDALIHSGFIVSSSFSVDPRESCTRGMTRRSPCEEPQTPQDAAVERCAINTGVGPDTIAIVDPGSMGRFYTLMNGRPMSEWFMARTYNPFGPGFVYIPLLIRREKIDNIWTAVEVLASEEPFAPAVPVGKSLHKLHFYECDGDEDVFCLKCEIKHCNCLTCTCILSSFIPISSLGPVTADEVSNVVPIVPEEKKAEDEISNDIWLPKLFDEWIQNWEVEKMTMNSFDFRSPPPPPPMTPLCNTPSSKRVYAAINEAVDTARRSGKIVIGCVAKLEYRGNTHFWYNHWKYGWTHIDIKLKKTTPMATSMRMRLLDILQRQRKYDDDDEPGYLMRQFRTTEFDTARAELTRFYGEDTRGRCIKLGFQDNKHYLLHDLNGEWWIIDLERELVQQHFF